MLKRSSARKVKQPVTLSSEVEAKSIDKKESKLTKQALRESSLTAYQAYSTDLLYHWGLDCDNWNDVIAKSDSENRELIIKALVNGNISPPASMQEVKKIYKKLAGTAYKRSGYASEQKDESVEDEDEEMEEDDEQAEQSLSLQEGPAAKKARMEPAAAAASSSSSSSEPANLKGRCTHCGEPNHAFFCTSCGLRGDKEYTHPQNVDIRNERKAASATGKSTSTSDTSTSSLSKRDKELERLTAVGDPFTAFTATENLKATEALWRVKKAHMGPSYMSPTDSLIKYIQSGKLTDIGFAVPITIKEHQAAKTTNSTLSTGENGNVTLIDTARPPKLESMSQLQFTVFSIIIPSLIANPTAITEWCALMRTTMQIEKDKDWNAAKDYIERTLQLCVEQRMLFGAVVREVLDSVWTQKREGSASAASASASASASSSAKSKKNRRSPPSSASTTPGHPTAYCRSFNAFGCAREKCLFRHVCSSCGESLHGARDCSKKPMPPLEKAYSSASKRTTAASYMNEKSKSDAKSD